MGKSMQLRFEENFECNNIYFFEIFLKLLNFELFPVK